MGIGGLIGGALTGIGRGMEMQAVAQQKEAEDMRRDDALMRRQTALAKYQADLQAGQNKVQHGYKLDESYPVELVNSVNPARIEGQKTAAFEIVDALGDAPEIHCLPVGNAGNITAYWQGYREYAGGTPGGVGAAATGGPATHLPQMWGFQAAGAAPIVLGHPVDQPETIATAIRIGNPASWAQAVAARDDSGGRIEAVTDEQILGAHRILSAHEGVFVEPGSAASVAGLLMSAEAGAVPPGVRIVCTVTGHGLKDPQWALRQADGSEVTPTRIPVDAYSAAAALGLEG